MLRSHLNRKTEKMTYPKNPLSFAVWALLGSGDGQDVAENLAQSSFMMVSCNVQNGWTFRDV